MRVESIIVYPIVPRPLRSLTELAHNLWYSWNADCLELFQKIDPTVWEKVNHTPVGMLHSVSQNRLDELAGDEKYLGKLARVHKRFRDYCKIDCHLEALRDPECAPIAYFSAEFGIHESLPLYSGGLGVLAGDLLKACSDLRFPIVGVGLFYHRGYFTQRIDEGGTQIEVNPQYQTEFLPLKLCLNSHDRPLRLNLFLGDEHLAFQVWRAEVGRVTLLLLDSDLEENTAAGRAITAKLYDSDRTIRLQQEILLGIGGAKALYNLGVNPHVVHINEGHSAFMLLERIRQIIGQRNLTFHEARVMVEATSLFTTHTPVPAGHEKFEHSLVESQLSSYLSQMSLSWQDFRQLGKDVRAGDAQMFSMTSLAMNLSSHVNAVSKIHREVSAYMFKDEWDLPDHEVPIGYVTNGVHSATWLSDGIKHLLGGEDQGVFHWTAIRKVSDAELWKAHLKSKRFLLSYLRQQRTAASTQISEQGLFIGFARRFSKYKRSQLIFQDFMALKKILKGLERPVYLIISGKAHPADVEGQNLLKQISKWRIEGGLEDHIIVLENYDMDLAKLLVQGVGLWLNNPIRLMEASGTSGMKAAMNGVLNLSILDGWWCEGYHPSLGWSISGEEPYRNSTRRDQMESSKIYRMLEHHILPLFDQRNQEGVPLGWVHMMKNSIDRIGTYFNAHRMVEEYDALYYSKGKQLHQRLLGEEKIRGLAAWRERIEAAWPQVKVKKVKWNEERVSTQESTAIWAWVDPSKLQDQDLVVDLYYGKFGDDGTIQDGLRQRMQFVEDQREGKLYEAKVAFSEGGRFGYSVSVMPIHKDLGSKTMPKYCRWYS